MNRKINLLLEYGLREQILSIEDYEYATNQLLYLLHLNQFTKEEIPADEEIDFFKLMDQILQYAFEHQCIPSHSITDFDHFEAKLMDCLMPRPKECNERFRKLYKQAPLYATNDFYHFSQKTNYIKTERIKKNIHYVYEGKYAPLDISINLSKPEKDPMAIIKQASSVQGNYPACALCLENVGYYGDDFHASRSNHRVISLTLNHEKDAWAFQYSPYSYFNEHAIILKKQHTPMKVDFSTFQSLVDFVNQFPHYTIGSNAGLKIVGGSILSHYHFQGGNATFPIEKAKVIDHFKVGRIEVEVLDWPMNAIRVIGSNEFKVIDLVNQIFEAWKVYSNPKLSIYHHSNGEDHNTVTPILKIVEGKYHFYLVLRNNYTTPDRPYGLYHPRDEYFHIKKENIGLIEVMGLAILPGRLKTEIEEMKQYLLGKTTIEKDSALEKHKAWLEEIKQLEYDQNHIEEFLEQEIGKVFEKVLEDCGVFKQENRKEFLSFVEKSIY